MSTPPFPSVAVEKAKVWLSRRCETRDRLYARRAGRSVAIDTPSIRALPHRMPQPATSFAARLLQGLIKRNRQVAKPLPQ